MAECKRIVVSLPDSLLKEVDNAVCLEHCNRSEFVRKAMKFYISEIKRINFIESMKKGYQEMTEINLALAEVGLTAEYETICRYESRLAECE
ncbi:CopG family ribbon-helix-helix protein [Lutispora thermophila]|uniref:Transcriptional regulator, CopG family n=1 Tax=Lutispora thermophila DSM 19022 TaxID=1122184 RepID=A0A1M6FK93_9FIRM|nr:ribbon-helix-helix protein, CopG family [Lutispora thermophila]SHI98086.1 transcriptional regulator, CopG family [Lutispora thermophila DSM 19022]